MTQRRLYGRRWTSRPFGASGDLSEAGVTQGGAGVALVLKKRGLLVRQPSMRIAVVSPLFESVPPKLYGGTERVVSYLTEELVRQGHSVTLFASGDSVTSARLRASTRHALRLDRDCRDPVAAQVL